MELKKLLILDMDETLIHTETTKDPDIFSDGSFDFSFPLGGGAWSYSPTYWYFVNKRPFLDEFMKYAFENFKVAVWTAGSRDYATEVLTRSGIDINKLEFFWSRERCTIKLDYESNCYYGEKNLNKVHKSLGWDLKDILIVDDVAKTAVNNYGNLILIKPFYYDTNDTELLKLMNYLERIKDSSNFRSIEKRGWSQ